MQHRSSGWKCCSQRRNIVPEGVAEATHCHQLRAACDGGILQGVVS
jgi:hypothetical protein